MKHGFRVTGFLVMVALAAGCPEPLDGGPARTTFSLQDAHARADCISCHGDNDDWRQCVDYEGLREVDCNDACETCHTRPELHANDALKAVNTCDSAGCHEDFVDFNPFN